MCNHMSKCIFLFSSHHLSVVPKSIRAYFLQRTCDEALPLVPCCNRLLQEVQLLWKSSHSAFGHDCEHQTSTRLPFLSFTIPIFRLMFSLLIVTRFRESLTLFAYVILSYWPIQKRFVICLWLIIYHAWHRLYIFTALWLIYSMPS